ncbi:hypothetical protein QTP70_018332 [Hemibagrus guttatus]|uniref:Thyroid transcription factor 1-associated protein 26 n=1 Tax=Hemibagrus guttatus TaxID=175788 RepID=A0AAE0QCC9_9TELE|nr:hypothetical protein QTP70_018332 [Hemibagrus guttatus]
MAPVNPHFKGKPFKGRNPKRKNTDSHPSAVSKKKKTWNPGDKFFQGSLQEGKGFAFQRKQKVQQEYKKLLRKEKWRMKDSKPKLEDEYPEHLRHLYMAEQQKMKEEEQLNKDRRRKGRSADVGEEEESAFSSSVARTSETGSPEKSAASLNDGPQTSQFESSSGQDQFKKKEWKKMSSNQKMMEEYKRKKEERERKREEYLKDKAQREEALKRYKEKKMATYQLLKKKTKKGQPNLNLQMELLLQKIQAQRK